MLGENQVDETECQFDMEDEGVSDISDNGDGESETQK
jgi:hypothetical protein